MRSGSKVCKSCRSRQEPSNEYLAFTCTIWRRYSRERASQSLPIISQKLENKVRINIGLAALRAAVRSEGGRARDLRQRRAATWRKVTFEPDGCAFTLYHPLSFRILLLSTLSFRILFLSTLSRAQANVFLDSLSFHFSAILHI